MINRDLLINEIEDLPDSAIEEVRKYILLQKVYHAALDSEQGEGAAPAVDMSAALTTEAWKKMKSMTTKRL